MLLTDNLAWRFREWLDRENEEPDLVRRIQRVWKAPIDSAREEPRYPRTALRRHAIFDARTSA